MEMNKLVNFVQDGWYNLLTGMGVAGKDKRENTTFGQAPRFDRSTLTEIYRGEGLGARIIKIPADDMVRRWFDIVGDTDGFVNMKLDEMSAKSITTEALYWDRLYGGAMIVIFLDDGQKLDMPVNEANIRDVLGLQVYDRNDCTWTSSDLYTDESKPNYGDVEYYNINNISTGKIFRVHDSRLMKFNGEIVPNLTRIENQGWGDSTIQSVYSRLRGLGDSFAGAEAIITEFIVGTLTIENLQALISSKEGTKKVQERLHLLDLSKHMLNTYLLNKNEKFERVSATGVAGMSDLINQLIDACVAVCGIPRVKLFGEQSKGLGSEAAGNIRLYYDEISSLQERKLQRPFEKLSKYIMLSRDGYFNGVELEEWSVRFKPLWQPTEEEVAKTRKVTADTDKIYYDLGLPGEVILLNRFGGNEYSSEIKLPENLMTAYEDVAENSNMEEEEKTGENNQ